jgi:hypothetical protein
MYYKKLTKKFIQIDNFIHILIITFIQNKFYKSKRNKKMYKTKNFLNNKYKINIKKLKFNII